MPGRGELGSCYRDIRPLGRPTMPRPLACLTAFALTALAASPLHAQEAAELCKAIGNVTLGQWASYTMSGGQADGAKIRLAIVGQERRGDSTLYWFEINGSGGPRGQGGIVQLLVPGFGGDAATIHGMIVKPEGQPAMKLPEQMVGMRSEERRVGKEGRSRWSPYH